jgi:hypothetical protein
MDVQSGGISAANQLIPLSTVIDDDKERRRRNRGQKRKTLIHPSTLVRAAESESDGTESAESEEEEESNDENVPHYDIDYTGWWRRGLHKRAKPSPVPELWRKPNQEDEDQEGGGGKRFPCTICKKTFKQAWSLKRHIKQFHHTDTDAVLGDPNSPAAIVSRQFASEKKNGQSIEDRSDAGSKSKSLNKNQNLASNKSYSRGNSVADQEELRHGNVLTKKQIGRLLHLILAAELGDVRITKKSLLGYLIPPLPTFSDHRLVDEESIDDGSDVTEEGSESDDLEIFDIDGIWLQILFAAKHDKLYLTSHLFSMIVLAADEAISNTWDN